MRSTVTELYQLLEEELLIHKSVNVIVVVGHERLHVEMQRLFGTYAPNSGINIVKVPKSGGVRTLTNIISSHLFMRSCGFYRLWN